MPDQSFSDIMLDLKNEFTKQSNSIKLGNIRKWSKTYPPDIRYKYFEKILNQDWDSIQRIAKSNAKSKALIIEEIKIKQKEIFDISVKCESNKPLILSNWKPWKKLAGWEESRSKLVDELEKARLTFDEINKQISFFENIEAENIFKLLVDPIKHSISWLDSLHESNLAYYIASIFTAAVSRFNKLTNSTRSGKLPSEAILEELSGKLFEMETNIWQAFRNKDLSEILTSADILISECTNIFMNALPGYAAAVSKKRKLEPDNAEFGELGLQVGNLFRNYLFGIALGKQADWLTKWGASASDTYEWMDTAASLNILKPFLSNSKVEISSLLAEPSKMDGKEILVEGFIGQVIIKHKKNGKVISSAPVIDSNGNSITLALPYIKLDSGGLVDGAYAKVAGTWKAISEETHTPALQIDRRSLEEESKTNWLIWAQKELKHVINVVPHNLAAEWSLEPGSSGAINSIRYGTWFTERRDD